LEQAARRSGAGRNDAEGARTALASPAARPEIAVAVAIAMGARRARVLLFSPMFILNCLAFTPSPWETGSGPRRNLVLVRLMWSDRCRVIISIKEMQDFILHLIYIICY
jgi:hypothetical protein